MTSPGPSGATRPGQPARTAFVTGASRGIGAGIARALAAAGHRVAVGYRERKEAAAAVVDELGVRAIAVQLDLADDASVRAAVASVTAALGPVELLVNNAATAREKPFLEIADADWEQVLSVNLIGAVRCVRACLPEMLAGSFGRIVNVCAVGGRWGSRDHVHDAASKAALIDLTRSLSDLYAAHGITSNAVAAGWIATETRATEQGSDAARAKAAGIPLGRPGTPEEVGSTVAFLCSNDAAYITGETFHLSGGASRQRS